MSRHPASNRPGLWPGGLRASREAAGGADIVFNNSLIIFYAVNCLVGRGLIFQSEDGSPQLRRQQCFDSPRHFFKKAIVAGAFFNVYDIDLPYLIIFRPILNMPCDAMFVSVQSVDCLDFHESADQRQFLT